MDYGLGSGSFTDLYVPTQIGTDNDWASVHAGHSHTLAIKTDGTMWSWGDNNRGKLGDGTTIDRSRAVQVGSATDWKTASAGDNSSFGIKTDGTLWEWGQSTTGGGALQTPTQLGTGTDWAIIRSADGSHFGIKTDGTLWAWGNNMVGQLGVGNNTALYVPTQVGTDADWQDVAGGYMHTVALKTDHTLWAMGAGNAIGMNSPLGEKSPKQIGSANTWMAIVSGTTHVLALGGASGTSSSVSRIPSDESIRVFPNPATSSISFDASQPIERISVLSVAGKLVVSGNTTTIDISRLPAGMYIYKIGYRNGTAGMGRFSKL